MFFDFQRRFEETFWSIQNNPQAGGNARALVAAMRTEGGRIVHGRYLSRETGSQLAGSGAHFKLGFEPLQANHFTTRRLAVRSLHAQRRR